MSLEGVLSVGVLLVERDVINGMVIRGRVCHQGLFHSPVARLLRVPAASVVSPLPSARLV